MKLFTTKGPQKSFSLYINGAHKNELKSQVRYTLTITFKRHRALESAFIWKLPLKKCHTHAHTQEVKRTKHDDSSVTVGKK